MTWTAPPTFRVGRAPTSDEFNDISDDLTFLHGAPACVFTRTAAGQNVASGNEVNLVFPDTLVDTDSMHLDNTHMRFTTAGLYVVGFSRVEWADNATGVRSARFRMPVAVWSHVVALTGAAAKCWLNATGIVRAAAAAEAVVGVYQNTGGNLDISPNHRTYAHWIGG